MHLTQNKLYEMGRAIVAASHAVGTVNGSAVDLSKGGQASFVIDVGSVGAAGTIVVKLQRSTDNSTWVDVASGEPGNDTTTGTLSAAGTVMLNYSNPSPAYRYVRSHATVAVNAVVASAAYVLGPLRHIEP